MRKSRACVVGRRGRSTERRIDSLTDNVSTAHWYWQWHRSCLERAKDLHCHDLRQGVPRQEIGAGRDIHNRARKGDKGR